MLSKYYTENWNAVPTLLPHLHCKVVTKNCKKSHLQNVRLPIFELLKTLIRNH